MWTTLHVLFGSLGKLNHDTEHTAESCTRLDSVINCKTSRELLCQICTLLLHTPCVQTTSSLRGRHVNN